jgi:hypothetical protein
MGPTENNAPSMTNPGTQALAIFEKAIPGTLATTPWEGSKGF